jgi:polyhydroxybutyrate depolymerase
MAGIFINTRGLCFLTATWLTILAPAQTTIDESFIHDGIVRTYRIYIPEIYDPSTEVPLLFNLHGYGSNNLEQEFYGDFRPIADTANFIIVHPNGTIDNNNNRFWNTFGGSNVDDLGFIGALADTIIAQYNIDQNRIYSAGMSNGGFMSYHLACFLSSRITAVASVTGSMTIAAYNTCDPVQPVPVMQVHGTLDAIVPYNGSFFFVPVETLVDFWVEHNNCDPEAVIIQIPDIDSTDGCTAEQFIFLNGDHGSSVEFFKITGGGHSWPGASVNINITNMDFSASTEIWRFLSQFSKDQLTTGIRAKNLSVYSFELFPNPSHGTFTLRFADDAMKTILITNPSGHKVLEQSSRCVQTELILPRRGLYLLTVFQRDTVETRKLIVN